MKNTFLALLFMVMVPALVNCQSPSKQRQILTPQEFEVKMTQVKGYTLLDVRTPEEYANGHLANATLMNFYDNDFKKQLATLDKSKPVFVYCAVGGRSGSAGTALIEMGFTEVYDLKGGIQSWTKAQKKVVK